MNWKKYIEFDLFNLHSCLCGFELERKKNTRRIFAFEFSFRAFHRCFIGSVTLFMGSFDDFSVRTRKIKFIFIQLIFEKDKVI